MPPSVRVLWSGSGILDRPREGSIRAVTLVDDVSGQDPDASYGITNATVDGNVLTVRVSYSGGCREHEFELIAARDFGASLPPELPTHLLHNAHGDSCKKLVREDIRFDLSPLKERYGRSYGASSGTIVVRLLGRRVEYRF